jgi:hypothetical protein
LDETGPGGIDNTREGDQIDGWRDTREIGRRSPIMQSVLRRMPVAITARRAASPM